jgi:hypothetical protein
MAVSGMANEDFEIDDGFSAAIAGLTRRIAIGKGGGAIDFGCHAPPEPEAPW